MKRFIKASLFPFIVIVVAYITMLLWGLSCITGDEMGYSLLCFYIFAPAIELLCGFFIGRKREWIKCLFPLTGLFNWFVSSVVFGGRMILEEFISLTIIATVPATIGLLAGTFSIKHPSKDNKMSAQDLI